MGVTTLFQPSSCDIISCMRYMHAYKTIAHYVLEFFPVVWPGGGQGGPVPPQIMLSLWSSVILSTQKTFNFPPLKPNHILNSCRPPHYQISRPATGSFIDSQFFQLCHSVILSYLGLLLCVLYVPVHVVCFNIIFNNSAATYGPLLNCWS